MQMFDLVPDVEVLLQMTPDELAGVIYEVSEGRKLHIGNFASQSTSHYPGQHRDAVQRAIFEALAWLEGQALLVWSDTSNGPTDGDNGAVVPRNWIAKE